MTKEYLERQFKKYHEITGDYVTPQMFGAKGDGVTDDTQAFLDMFASGKNVYIAEGLYYITKRIRITNNVIIDGAGAARTIIMADQNFDYSTSNDPTFFRIASNVVIKNVGFYIHYDITRPYHENEVTLLAGEGSSTISIDHCGFRAEIPTKGLEHGVNLVWGQGTTMLEVRNSMFQNYCNSIQGGCVWWYNWSPYAVGDNQSFNATKIIIDNNYIEHSTRDEAIGVWTSNDDTRPLWDNVQITNNNIVHEAFIEDVDAYTSDNLISVNANTAEEAWNYNSVIIEGNTLFGNYDSRCFIKAACNMGGMIIRDNYIEDNSSTRDSSIIEGIRIFDIMSCYNANIINNTFRSTAARTGNYDVGFKSSGSINYIGNKIICDNAYFTFSGQNTLADGYTDMFNREVINIRNNDIITPNFSFYPTARVSDFYFTDNNIVNTQPAITISVYKNINWFIERNKFSAGSYTRTNNNIEGGSLHLIDNQNYSWRVYEDKVVTKWSELELAGKKQTFEVSSTNGATPYNNLTNDILNEFATVLNVHIDSLDTLDIWQAQSQLGAKNLLAYPYSDGQSKTTVGVTFTAGSDGNINVNGTTGEGQYAVFWLENNVTFDIHDTVILSTSEQLPMGISIQVNGNAYINRSQRTVNFTVSQGDTLQAKVVVEPNTTITDLTIYPMLRLASDPDSTWVPYAPTNYQLGQDIKTVSDYENLSNQPRINSVRLTGNKSSADLGLQPNMSTAAKLSFGALASLTAYLNSNRKIPNNSTIHINDYDTDYVVSARAEGDTEDSCIFISDTQKITPYYQLGVLDIRAFGAGHTNTAENSAKIVKAIKYAQGNGIKLYVPRGRWYLKESVPLSGSTVIEGATSAGDRGLYFANCSMLFFDPEQSNVSMFTESGTHTLSIRNITLACGKIVGNEKQLYTTYEGDYTTQVAEIPHNYMTWAYSYENVNCLNCYNDSNPRGTSSWLDLLDVNIVGFSGYGVKCGMALALDSVRFLACKYGFYNVLTDTQFHNTFIQGCEYGFYWNNGGTVLHAYDTWIDQCKYGVYSNGTLAGIFQGGEIDHCLYAGVCCLGTSDLKIEARFGRLGMYYLGEDMLTKAQAITAYTEEAFLDMSKGVDIAIRWGNKFNFDLSEEPKNISDNGTETSKLPTLLVFGQTLRGIIKTAHNFKDRAYYAIQNACVTTIDAYSLTNIAELPTPAAYRLDKLFLLTEAQTGYAKGGIYKCVAKGTDPETYKWELINTPSGGGGGSFTTLEQEVILSTDSEIQCAFSDSSIKANSAIQVFIDAKDIYYKTMDISDGLVVITFTPQISSRIINVRIYIM